MNIPIFGFLLNAATRWTPRTSQNIAEKLRYPRSNILFSIFQVFFKKKTLIRVEHKIFPNSRGLIEFSRLHLTPRNVKYINRVVAQNSPKFCCTVIIAFDKYLHELFFAIFFHLSKNLFLTLKNNEVADLTHFSTKCGCF